MVIVKVSAVVDTNNVNASTNKERVTEYIDSNRGPIILYKKKLVGKGTYSEVYKGIFKSKTVAVKISSFDAAKCWKNEGDALIMLNHPSILKHFGNDMMPDKLFLITEYHPRGSLYNFLRDQTLDTRLLLCYIQSISYGLQYLHNSTKLKPTIVHRDLNTVNILRKVDDSLCIADFGFAVTEEEVFHTPKFNYSVGTRRYMAPEIFDNSVGKNSFELLMKTDIYGLSLVFWELCRRTVTTDDGVDDHILPYQDIIPNNPQMEEMEEKVCSQGTRPSISPRWKNDFVTDEIIKIAEKCWLHNPSDRPSINEIVEKLNSLQQ